MQKKNNTPNKPPRVSQNKSSDQEKKGKPWKGFVLAMILIVLFLGAYFIGKKVGIYAMNEEAVISDPYVVNSDSTMEDEQIKKDAEALKGKISGSNNDESANSGLVYENKEFGFRLKFPSSWDGFKFKEDYLGGDFEVYSVKYYLPTKELNEFAEMEGYFSPFAISVYVKESWDDPARDTSMDDMSGEEVGRNDSYVFLYSHFNGFPPSDISNEVVQEMDNIAKSIEVFDSYDYRTE